jgi:glycosyltransferase involved in cell wall biosynthesis
MKVLHFYKSALPDTLGGVAQVIDQLARALAPMGVETDVLSLSDQSDLPIDMNGYTAYRVKKQFSLASTDFSLKVFKSFQRLAQSADIIHYHFPWPLMDVVHFLSKVDKPCVVTYHADIIRQKNLLKLYRPLKYKFLNQMDSIVATSPNYLDSSEILKKYASKVEVIPIGLDQASYPKPSDERLNHWKSIVGEKFFLFVGVLRYYKGLHILLEALDGANLPVVILGSGPVEKQLKLLARRKQIKNLHFVGALSDQDKCALLTLCLAMIFPSHIRTEAFGISLLEGAMFGKALISSEIGTGTSYINQDGVTGFVVPANDPAALFQAMTRLHDNQSLAHSLGQAARQRFEEVFTANQMAESYLKLYKRLLANSQPSHD